MRIMSGQWTVSFEQHILQGIIHVCFDCCDSKQDSQCALYAPKCDFCLAACLHEIVIPFMAFLYTTD